ncbi:uncharacterized protein MELLADRAFT_67206 [Melampsora larici-populina 98AG31]|uniref:Uncharacterized protein n=1 Tax=Melampsora larici-populina (strain 98AG31 / pathotype 3-4-7) TaxID=747676 RepID=F4S270_MELLP|nr:uncharacterized protein MELLADRAFT_67206 [Melampsora larici-populina 98AG31]EGG01306.1 hypothetical protein MELLADRAFT_67206 [Melampsora larici-populina 98AG31]
MWDDLTLQMGILVKMCNNPGTALLGARVSALTPSRRIVRFSQPGLLPDQAVTIDGSISLAAQLGLLWCHVHVYNKANIKMVIHVSKTTNKSHLFNGGHKEELELRLSDPMRSVRPAAAKSSGLSNAANMDVTLHEFWK